MNRNKQVSFNSEVETKLLNLNASALALYNKVEHIDMSYDYELSALDNIFEEIALLEKSFKRRKVLSSTYQPPKPIRRPLV